MKTNEFVIFNCSGGSITITFGSEEGIARLSTLSSHHRRREARQVFKQVTIRRNSSKDLVAETGLTVEELERNEALLSLIRRNKMVRIFKAEEILPEEVVEKIEEVKVGEVVEKVEEVEVVPQVVGEIIEEVVDEEELRRQIMSEALEEDKELLGLELEELEEPVQKKRGRKPGKK